MVPQKCLHYLRRLHEMGLSTAWMLTTARLKKRWFFWRWKRHTDVISAVAGTQKSLKKIKNWIPAFAGMTSFRRDDKLRDDKRHFCQAILNDPLFQASLPTRYKTSSSIYHQADKAARPCITILGYGSFCFNGPIIWHTDVTTTRPSPTSWQAALCTQITPQAGVDIKVPWELSRLQHLFALGLGYQQATADNQQAKALAYAEAFVSQVSDWINQNPFLIGVNWTNPMEVAIRSINLIWAWSFFADAPTIKPSFWQQLAAALHNHMICLANTWEVSDRPNNHYLADLVGYLYLSVFFGIKRPRFITHAIKQFTRQLNPDGTSYEGSTAYHQLDTELLLHFILVCKHAGYQLPAALYDRLNTMQTFLYDCTDTGGNRVQIGDNDSGSIVSGLELFRSHPFDFARKSSLRSGRTVPTHIPAISSVISYPSFGLTIIKTPVWHITFRHPTYAPHQPTGHFHQDWLAITVSINGIPVFIDPGSYQYTSNPAIRNQFRSLQSHNTFYPHNIMFQATDLFQLPRTPHQWTATINQTATTITISDRHHEFYPSHGIIAHRTLCLDLEQQAIIITDWWEGVIALWQTTWHMHLAPACTLTQVHKTATTISSSNQAIATITTPIAYTISDGCYSPDYGACQPSKTLTTQACWEDKKIVTEIRLLPHHNT